MHYKCYDVIMAFFRVTSMQHSVYVGLFFPPLSQLLKPAKSQPMDSPPPSPKHVVCDKKKVSSHVPIEKEIEMQVLNQHKTVSKKR